MPIFDYECKECGASEKDVLRSFSEADAEYVCKQCGTPMVKNFGSGGHFKLKGHGFHNTDYGGPTSR